MKLFFYIDNPKVGKWQMVEYAEGSVNSLDTITFYENGKMDNPFETGEFTYHFMLINRSWHIKC